jgi:hypothetical protein
MVRVVRVPRTMQVRDTRVVRGTRRGSWPHEPFIAVVRGTRTIHCRGSWHTPWFVAHAMVLTHPWFVAHAMVRGTRHGSWHTNHSFIAMVRGTRRGSCHPPWFVAHAMVRGTRHGSWHTPWFVAHAVVPGTRRGSWHTRRGSWHTPWSWHTLHCRGSWHTNHSLPWWRHRPRLKISAPSNTAPIGK